MPCDRFPAQKVTAFGSAPPVGARLAEAGFRDTIRGFSTAAYGPSATQGVHGTSPSTRTRGFMTTIRVKENEPFDVALRRFKRTIEKIGLLTELRAREFYEKPTSERKRKKAAAVKRHYKRVRSMQLPKKLF